jgi:RecA-family ATPase
MPTPFHFLTTSDRESISPKAWLVEGLIAEGEFSLMIGRPEAGKSALALDLVASISTGRRWFGRQTHGSSAVFFAPERHRPTFRRLIAAELHHGMAAPDVAIVPALLDFRTGTADADRAIATIRAHEERSDRAVKLVVFDNLMECLAGGDENGPRDMGAVARCFHCIRRATGAHVLVIAHPSMDPRRGHEPRGHKSLLASADVTIEVVEKNGGREWRVRKASDFAVKPQESFSLLSVSLEMGESAPVVISGGDDSDRERDVREVLSAGPMKFSDLTRQLEGAPSFTARHEFKAGSG